MDQLLNSITSNYKNKKVDEIKGCESFFFFFSFLLLSLQHFATTKISFPVKNEERVIKEKSFNPF